MYDTICFLLEEEHEKGWGKEVWYVSDNNYCLKRLIFNKPAKKTITKFSSHFHKDKKETWIIEEGEFTLEVTNLRDASTTRYDLKKGYIIDIPPFVPHQLSTETGGTILEVSTKDDPNDNYRIKPGDSQK